MPSLASGCSCCTACASTCAAECRITLRPASVSAATGSTSASASGAQARSRSVPSASRTTTTASGRSCGSPASRTAAPAVVPAGTRTGADAGRTAGADTGTSREVRRKGRSPMLEAVADRIPAHPWSACRSGRGRGARGAGSAAGGDGGRGGPLDAAADPVAVEPAAGRRAAGRSATGGPAACCPGSRSTGSGSRAQEHRTGLRATWRRRAYRLRAARCRRAPAPGRDVPACPRCRAPVAGIPAVRATRTRQPGGPAPGGAGVPPWSGPGGRAPPDGREPKPIGTRPAPGSGWAGTSGPGASNDHPPRDGRRVIDGPAVNASTDTASQPLADAVQHALRPVHDDRQNEPVAVRVRHRTQQVPGPAVRTEDDLAGAGRSARPRARNAAAPGRCGRSRRAARRSVPGPADPVVASAAAADQASSTMPLSTSTRAAATIRTSRSSGPSTTAMPSARMFTTWRWRPTNRPAARSRNPRSISGGRRWTGRTPGCRRDRSGPPSGCP